MIVIIDYGVGNLGSVEKAFKALGEEVLVTNNPEDLKRGDAIVLPGVGAFKVAMEKLRGSNMVDAIYDAIKEEKPFLGICLGLQMLFQSSEEGGEKVEGLGILEGQVKRFSKTSLLKVPHMGWNNVHPTKDVPIFDCLDKDSYFYFVHSYYLKAANREEVIGTTEYDVVFDSIIQRGNLVACQFHPEKSGKAGLSLLANFIKMIQERKVHQ